MKKKYSSIVKLALVATAALLLTTTPVVQPLWWLAGY